MQSFVKKIITQFHETIVYFTHSALFVIALLRFWALKKERRQYFDWQRSFFSNIMKA